MNIFFDTEFTGLRQNTDLISIGIVAEFDDTFYAEFTDYDKNKIDDWLQTNIIENLEFNNRDPFTLYTSDSYSNKKECSMKGTKKEIANEIIFWLTRLNSKSKIDVWSDCLSWDWVLFSELYGGGLYTPEQLNYIPFDIATLFKIKGIDPDINREDFVKKIGKKHNALHDAIIIKSCYNKLMNM